MSQIFTEYTEDAATKGRQSESKTEWLKTEQGENFFRIMPPLQGMSEPWVTVFQHFHKLPNGKIFVFNCPQRMLNKPCPTCMKKSKLEGATDAASIKEMENCKVSSRNIAFAIDRDNPEAGIRAFGFGATIKDRLRYFRDKLKKDFTNLQTGFDVVIDKTGEGLGTKYQVDTGAQGPVVESGSMKAFNRWAEDLPDLRDFQKVLEFDEIVNKASHLLGATPAPNQLMESTETVEDSIATVDANDDIPF